MEYRGTRRDVILELLRLAEGWDHLSNESKRMETEHAAIEIEDGADEVVVGRTKYIVAERDRAC